MKKFKLHSEYRPAGDQPNAIKSLVKGIQHGDKHQLLLGVTGSGKTYTVANVIEQIQKPTLVIAHNKTLAAQLAQEYTQFFPQNAVHFFVSYYDHYQPEAYMPITDTYIEKEAQINEEIERLRHASTQALLTRNDVIIVASVSCIYGLGSPDEYLKVQMRLTRNMLLNRADLIRNLIDIHFSRTNADLNPGTFRAISNVVEIMPVNEKFIYRVEFGASCVVRICAIDNITRRIIEELDDVFIFPARHFITPENERKRAGMDIKAELKSRLKELNKNGKILEHERLKRRVTYDLAMIKEMGYCSGIENYSRHFDGRPAGEPPSTLISYFPHYTDGTPNFLTIIDESHVTVPQLGGMYAGDKARKETLIEHGFRLPSALDNRPLRFDEFDAKVGQRIYTSATPSNYERENSTNIAEQIIRPTGLIDPLIKVRPIIEKGAYKGQIKDLINEAEKAIKKKGRVIATTLTKKMAEDLSEYLKEKNIKSEYVHSDIKTIDRITILSDFRKGVFDVLVGVNLLREGLDLPEVTFIGILDADKEGFLRSDTALIQIIGRAARNIEGHVYLYADKITGSMQRAIDETNRRRERQMQYNKLNNITPKTIQKNINDITEHIKTEHQLTVNRLLELDREKAKNNPSKLIKEKQASMNSAVKILDFETAAILRDEITELQKLYEK